MGQYCSWRNIPNISHREVLPNRLVTLYFIKLAFYLPAAAVVVVIVVVVVVVVVVGQTAGPLVNVVEVGLLRSSREQVV